MTKEIWRWTRLITGVGMVIVLTIANLIYQPNMHTHYHAGFLVYIDGVKQDYSGSQYMNTAKCTLHERRKSAAEEQVEKAHLHDNVGDVVHVHRTGARWGDLFKNIKVALPKNKEVNVYINGMRAEQGLKTPIMSNTSALIIVGDNAHIDMSLTIQQSHIKEIEAKSESCGD